LIKSRIRWLGHVGDRRGVYKDWWGDLEKKGNFGNLGVDRSIILKRMFNKWHEVSKTGLV